MKRLSKKQFIFLVAFLGGFLILVAPRMLFGPVALLVKFEGFKKEKQIYYCPMHPTYVSDRPGDCPICNMKLVPKSTGKAKKGRKILYYRHPMGAPDRSPVPKKDSMGMDYVPVYEDEQMGTKSAVPGRAMIQIPVEKQQVIGVKLGQVEKRKLTKEIRTVGRVAFDPDLYTAQQEFLSAVESARKAKGGPYHEPSERTESLLESVKVRLRLLGMSETEMSELEKEATRDQNLILPPETSKDHRSLPYQYVWVYGTIYEYELPFVKVGAEVKIKVPTFPDREFLGQIRSLDPVLNPETRSIRVRARVKNTDGLLKPEMYVDLYLSTELKDALVIPEEAAMLTGERAIVFVAYGNGFFEPREVKLGTKTGNVYEVKEGLKEGEAIAISGNFLIDSESRLQAAFQGMSGGEGAHQHGA